MLFLFVLCYALLSTYVSKLPFYDYLQLCISPRQQDKLYFLDQLINLCFKTECLPFPIIDFFLFFDVLFCVYLISILYFVFIPYTFYILFLSFIFIFYFDTLFYSTSYLSDDDDDYNPDYSDEDTFEVEEEIERQYINDEDDVGGSILGSGGKKMEPMSGGVEMVRT